MCQKSIKAEESMSSHRSKLGFIRQASWQRQMWRVFKLSAKRTFFLSSLKKPFEKFTQCLQNGKMNVTTIIEEYLYIKYTSISNLSWKKSYISPKIHKLKKVRKICTSPIKFNLTSFCLPDVLIEVFFSVQYNAVCETLL